jgi:cobalt-zinc-cadmium efflux system protein
MQVLLEGSPSEINSEQLIEDIRKIRNVTNIHDFHLWSISVGKFALSAHITAKGDSSHEVLKLVTQLCKKKYAIDHITIQMENDSFENEHYFECE